MYNLPSEQKALSEKAINTYNKEGGLEIYEPCNCGVNIRCGNGNSHKIILLKADSGKHFVKWETTCRLVARAQWEEVPQGETVASIISEHADWL